MRRFLVTALALPLAALCFAPARAALHDVPFGGAKAGTAAFTNPIVPDPPISVPPTASCTVKILKNYPFQNFTPATGTYTPPAACPGPWAKVVLTVETKVSGVQFDRVGAMWIGNDEIFRFTTSEPPGPQIHWTVQKDVTEYSNVLQSANPYAYSLGNVVNGTYTGIYYVTASLTFYEPGSGYPAATVPDDIIPIANTSSSTPWFTLNTSTDQASGAVTVPPNTQSAVLELYASGHICEEFWYANESDAFESQFGSSCGGTAYREIQVYVDGKPAGVALAYPYLYTGAIYPISWLPLTGYDTLDIPPYVFDLTPFVGLMNDGNPHTIAAQVFNDTGGFWLVDGDLLIAEDHGSAKTSGKLVYSTPAVANPEHYYENLNIQTGGNAFYSGADRVEASGYVDTSQGRITTTVNEHIGSDDIQYLTNPSSSSGGSETVALSANSNTVDTVSLGSTTTTTTTTTTWPFYLGLTSVLVIDQPFHQRVTTVSGGTTTWSSKDVVINSLSGPPQTTTVNYKLLDSAGDCYNRSLAASYGKLTSDTYACGGPMRVKR